MLLDSDVSILHIGQHWVPAKLCAEAICSRID